MEVRLALRFFLLAAWCTSVVGEREPVQEWKLHIPRVTVQELRANATLRDGTHAFILEGATTTWRARNWTISYLKKTIPNEWVDYYPDNMADVGNKPYLLNLKDAVPMFLKNPGPKYMQIRVGYRGWLRLLRDFEPMPVPEIFWTDEEWVSECMRKDGRVDDDAVNNFFVTNQWKFLLIGEEGTSMFFHSDGTAASSWQAQLVGQKRWTLCPNSQSHLLHNSQKTFDPNFHDPKFAKALCGQVTVNPGEILYYPAYWWHHTLQTQTPSIAFTGALVGTERNRDDLGRGNRKVHAAFMKDLQEKCARCWTRGQPNRHCEDISLKWPGAAPPPLRVVCDTYLPQCYKLWEEHAAALHGRNEL